MLNAQMQLLKQYLENSKAPEEVVLALRALERTNRRHVDELASVLKTGVEVGFANGRGLALDALEATPVEVAPDVLTPADYKRGAKDFRLRAMVEVGKIELQERGLR